MKKTNKIWAIVVTVLCVVVVTVAIVDAYNKGIEKGRNETVTMINEDLDQYTFTIKSSDGWTCGLLSHGTLFPGSDWSECLHTNYDWEDGKLLFSYEHH